MKNLIIALLIVLMSNQALAGVKGSVGYEMQSSQTHTQSPYTICTPTCQTVTNDYYSDYKNNTVRLKLGYEQQISGPVAIDLMAGTTPSLFDLRVESNLIFNVNDNLKVKAGVNRYQEKSDSTFNYKPGTGYQAGIEYKLPTNGEIIPFVDINYHSMNTSYEFSGSNFINDEKKDAVSIGIGFSF